MKQTRSEQVVEALVTGQPPPPVDGTTTTTEILTDGTSTIPSETLAEEETPQEAASFLLCRTVALQVIQVTPFHGIVHWADEAGHQGNLALERGQAVQLGSLLLKLGNKLMRQDGLHVPEGAEQELILPGQ